MLPGDTGPITITPERPFFLRRGSWIANSSGVEIDTQWGGMANVFGGWRPFEMIHTAFGWHLKSPKPGMSGLPDTWFTQLPRSRIVRGGSPSPSPARFRAIMGEGPPTGY
jgi:hypothetical protein